MSALWPWLALAGLGAYHGLNPAMGWLFAVALGLHRGGRAVVLQSLGPIAIGHALAIALATTIVVTLGLVIDQRAIRIIAAGVLIGWAGYLVLHGSHHRARVGMQAGFLGLMLWSFLMATAHGAGLMLVPALIPLCLSKEAAGSLAAPRLALFAVGVHTLAMLTVTGVVALAVHEWLGVAFLRRGWLNLDRVWTAALVAIGVAVLVF
jgi:hypothetical protein